MRCDIDRGDACFERKTMRYQLRKVESVAVAAEDQVGDFVEDVE